MDYFVEIRIISTTLFEFIIFEFVGWCSSTNPNFFLFISLVERSKLIKITKFCSYLLFISPSFNFRYCISRNRKKPANLPILFSNHLQITISIFDKTLCHIHNRKIFEPIFEVIIVYVPSAIHCFCNLFYDRSCDIAPIID